MSVIIEYFEALERLKKNSPINVPKGTKINNDSVALEAGRKKGSIKKSRSSFSQLIEAIEEAANSQKKPANNEREKIAKAKKDAEHYRTLYEESLAREVMHIKRIYELEDKISKLTINNVVSIKQNK